MAGEGEGGGEGKSKGIGEGKIPVEWLAAATAAGCSDVGEMLHELSLIISAVGRDEVRARVTLSTSCEWWWWCWCCLKSDCYLFDRSVRCVIGHHGDYFDARYRFLRV